MIFRALSVRIGVDKSLNLRYIKEKNIKVKVNDFFILEIGGINYKVSISYHFVGIK